VAGNRAGESGRTEVRSDGEWRVHGD
jgi:hypothetical protein